MSKISIILAIAILPYLILCLKAIRAIIKSPVLSKRQKLLQIACTILIPYLWAVIIVVVLKPVPGYKETDPQSRMDFYESGGPGSWTGLNGVR